MNFCLDNYKLSNRNGTYGGKAGSKEGIVVDGENWIVKYPQNTKGMRGPLATYTTAPLSEYIGSNIYNILGIEAHKTRLGIRNGKLVVACKDFCKTEGSLREIRTLKNVYNKELNEKLEASLSSTSDSHLINMEDILIHLDFNPILHMIPEIKKRFWEQVLVDVLINNNDRNNGNWGVLYEDGNYKIAPVLDNGAAFSNKLPDSKLTEILEDKSRFIQSVNMSKTVYALGGKPLYAKDLCLIENEEFYKTAEYLVPIMEKRMEKMKDFINDIPEKNGDVYICSDVRKKYYIKSIEYRYNYFILPVYKK
ncbi:MAG: CtkA family protein [Lachnospiraceae bacterium]|nr:CtkA family protein [Lachnospiraceae bacterium]